MEISDSIRKALQELIRSHKDKQAGLSRETGISEAVISRWASGKINEMKDKSWRKIEPLISPHLKIEDQAYNSSLNEEEDALISRYRCLYPDDRNYIYNETKRLFEVRQKKHTNVYPTNTDKVVNH